MLTLGLGRGISLTALIALFLLQSLKCLYDKRSFIRMLIILAGIGALAYESYPAKADSLGTVKVKDSDWLKDSGGDIPDGVPVRYPCRHWRYVRRSETRRDCVRRGTHLRRDTVIPQWFQASKAAAASDGHAVHC